MSNERKQAEEAALPVVDEPMPDLADIFPEEGQAAGPGRGKMLAVAGTMAMAVVISAVALWYGQVEAGRIDALELRLAQLPQRPPAASRPLTAQMQEELRQLATRVNQLEVIIEGPISHLRKSNEESMAALSERLDKLEQSLTAAPRAVAAESHDKDVSPGANPAATGGWVINLIALSNQTDAQDEMTRLRKVGVRVQMQRAQAEGKTWYRLRVPGFASYEGAKAYIDTVEKRAGVRNAWVAKE